MALLYSCRAAVCPRFFLTNLIFRDFHR
jgi:hypothetical protein